MPPQTKLPLRFGCGDATPLHPGAGFVFWFGYPAGSCFASPAASFHRMSRRFFGCLFCCHVITCYPKTSLILRIIPALIIIECLYPSSAHQQNPCRLHSITYQFRNKWLLLDTGKNWDSLDNRLEETDCGFLPAFRIKRRKQSSCKLCISAESPQKTQKPLGSIQRRMNHSLS